MEMVKVKGESKDNRGRWMIEKRRLPPHIITMSLQQSRQQPAQQLAQQSAKQSAQQPATTSPSASSGFTRDPLPHLTVMQPASKPTGNRPG